MAKESGYFTIIESALTFQEANKLDMEALEREYKRVWMLDPIDESAASVQSDTLYNIFIAYANKASLKIRQAEACSQANIELRRINEEKIEELQNGIEMKRLTDKLDIIKDMLEDAISEIEDC